MLLHFLLLNFLYVDIARGMVHQSFSSGSLGATALQSGDTKKFDCTVTVWEKPQVTIITY